MKKYVALTLCGIVFFCMLFVSASASENTSRDVSTEIVMATHLKELGLFKGVSETNFDLERAPTRVEALVMLIRVLGKEQDALTGTWRHPFTDVPAWANSYVGYAYVNGLTNGVSATKFGGGDATATTYLTFMLRALGYSDVNNADFAWDNPYDLAKSIGILTDRVDIVTFWRADTVTISYASLNVRLKGSTQTLAEKLISVGVFTAENYAKYYDVLLLDRGSVAPVTPVTPVTPGVSDGKLSAQQISDKCASAVFYIDVYSYNGELAGSGSGFFISADGLAITNFHVASNSSYFVITTADGKKHDDVTVIDAYKEQDLALLRVVDEESFPYLEIDSSFDLVQGQTVYAIGSPLGLENTMSRGIVSNTKRVIDGTEYVQISVPIAPGSSGGALINEYGKVVGVTTAGYSTGDLNLAVPIKFASKLDMTATERVDIWSDVFYPGFYEAYDFGSFTGVQLLSVTDTPLGYIYRYDATDYHDLLNPIDPGAPWREKSTCYAFSLVYYYMALEEKGFIGEDIDKQTKVFMSDTEIVLIDRNMTDMVITVMVEYMPQYYPEVPIVPDIGWYMGIGDGDVELNEVGEYSYFYKWNDYLSQDDFNALLTMYFEWMEDEGFSVVESGESETDNYLYVFFANQDYEVYIAFDEKYVLVIIAPVFSYQPPSQTISNPVAYLKDYLVHNGKYVNENGIESYYVEYTLVSSYDFEYVYTITYTPTNGRLYIQQSFVDYLPNNNGSFWSSTRIFLEGYDSTVESTYVTLSHTYPSGEFYAGIGFVNRQTVMKDRSIQLIASEQDPHTVLSMASICFLNVSTTVLDLDEVFSKLGISLTKEDLGFVGY